jgi:hypothetical protein
MHWILCYAIILRPCVMDRGNIVYIGRVGANMLIEVYIEQAVKLILS